MWTKTSKSSSTNKIIIFASSSSSTEEGRRRRRREEEEEEKEEKEENKMNSVESLAISALRTATRSSSLNNNNINNIKNNNNSNNNNVVKLNKPELYSTRWSDSFKINNLSTRNHQFSSGKGEYTSQNTPPWRNLRSYSPLRLGFSSRFAYILWFVFERRGVQRITLIFSE